MSGDITVISVTYSVTWAAAGYCVAGLAVAIMIVDTINGVNPIAKGSTLDNISSNLDSATGKPIAQIKRGIDHEGSKIDESIGSPVKKIKDLFN